MRITQTTYRGIDGYLVSGTDGNGRSGQRIFTETRTSAELIRDKKRRGEEITAEDFIG